MFTLENIIDSKAGREIKRAIAVKMVSQGFLVKDICELLDVSAAFVSKWKRIYEEQGAKGLHLRYQGSTGFLTPHQRGEVILHLKNQTHFSVDELRDFIERRYGVVYQSKQSYYDLLKAAGISWHRTEPVNPKRDEAKVLQKREEIKSILHAREAEIKSGEVIVFMEDECHLLSGDTSGYVWGRRNERLAVPIQNAKERQTYYGVIDGYHRAFILQPSTAGNGKNTIALLEHLQQLHEGKKLILIWDGASYHRSSEIKAYLAKVNEGLEEKNWKVTCLRFATNAPDQNPVEDIWLRGKNFLRKHFYENKTFSQVKNSFFDFLNQQIFNFKKLEWYLEIPQII